MISPQSSRQGDTGRCDQNGLGCAEKWTSVPPCLGVRGEEDGVDGAGARRRPGAYTRSR